MVDTLTLVLAGVLLYTLLAWAAKRRGLVPDYVRMQGPITTLHTERGKAFLDWLATPKRFWRAWGNFGVGVALVVMIVSFVLVLLAGLQSLRNPTATPVNQPQNVLVIPGVNDFLPLAATPAIVFGLLVGLVVHEGGHGLLCRVEDIDIDSMGLALLAFIPIGAFVEPDEESRSRADRGSQTRMFAAGVTNNFAISIVAVALLFGPVVGSIAAVQGVPVGDALAGSAASQSGIETGDVITTVEGRPVTNASELETALESEPGRNVTLGLRSGRTVTLQRHLIMTRAVPSAVRDVDLRGRTPPRVTAVEGEPVYTEAELRALVADDPRVRLSTTAGNTTLVAGAYVAQVVSGSAFDDAGAPTGKSLVITRIGGERVVDTAKLMDELDRYAPGDVVTVRAFVDGEPREYQVTLGGSGDDARLGVTLRRGIGGVVFSDAGIDPYPASTFLDLLGGEATGDGLKGFVRAVGLLLMLPFLSVLAPGLNYNFAGFNGYVTSFYTVQGPLEPLGGGVLVLANVLFWLAWVNIQIGLFNFIPAFPLDGGHILRSSTEAVVSRLPVSNDVAVTKAVTTTVGLSMLVSLLLMLFGSQIAGALS